MINKKFLIDYININNIYRQASKEEEGGCVGICLECSSRLLSTTSQARPRWLCMLVHDDDDDDWCSFSHAAAPAPPRRTIYGFIIILLLYSILFIHSHTHTHRDYSPSLPHGHSRSHSTLAAHTPPLLLLCPAAAVLLLAPHLCHSHRLKLIQTDRETFHYTTTLSWPLLPAPYPHGVCSSRIPFPSPDREIIIPHALPKPFPQFQCLPSFHSMLLPWQPWPSFCFLQFWGCCCSQPPLLFLWHCRCSQVCQFRLRLVLGVSAECVGKIRLWSA